MSGIDLPEHTTRSVEIPLDGDERAELRRRAAEDELAPEEERVLLRYLVYLGQAYIEAEKLVDEADSWRAAYEALQRPFGGIIGQTSVLHFHFGEAERGFAEEQRAHAAHERMAGAYEGLVEKMEAEIALREERLLISSARCRDDRRAACRRPRGACRGRDRPA